MADGGSASEPQIELALCYHEMFPEDRDAAIGENRRSGEQLHEESPFVAVWRPEG